MQSNNPYQPPQSESTLIEREIPSIFVDGVHLVVASGVALPKRCIKTNEPVTEQDAVEQTLEWRGRTFQFFASTPECKLRWYANRSVRWRSLTAKIIANVLLLVVVLSLFFGIDRMMTTASGLTIVAFCGIISLILFRVQTMLTVVNFRDSRFWIAGCCPEFLKMLEQELGRGDPQDL
jgi:hypothetical protein